MKEGSPCKGCVFYDEGGYGVAQEGIISHCHHSEFYNRMDVCPVIQSYYIKRNLGLNEKEQMGDRGTCDCDTCRHVMGDSCEDLLCGRFKEMTPEGWEALERGACPLWEVKE